MRHSICAALAANIAFVVLALSFLLIFGRFIVAHWVGVAIADAATGVLPILAWASALSALSVTGCYALLAMGRARAPASLTVAGGLAMICSLTFFVPRFGLAGVAYSRLLPGCVALLVYIPLTDYLRKQRAHWEPGNQFSQCGEV